MPHNPKHRLTKALPNYDAILADVVGLLQEARRVSAKAVNAVITSTYWTVGQRIVEAEQKGARKAKYGEHLIEQLSQDLIRQFGRGFSKRNLEQMRSFYLAWPIAQTPSAQSALPPARLHERSLPTKTKPAKPRGKLLLTFPLPWSHYVRLLAIDNPMARQFYETEALRGGWSVRQLDRQVNSQFYERTALSRDRAAMLTKHNRRKPTDQVTPEEELKDPFVLELLGLKDEYSESDIEEALIRHLETFLLELGGDFAFIGRQRRLRIGNTWYRLDLLFFHRRLRCLVLIDLKTGEFTHADAGQMHLYCNYANEHWTNVGENPPVGLILCAQKDSAVAKYALEGLPNKVMATEYRTTLPDENLLAVELEKTRQILESRRTSKRASN